MSYTKKKDKNTNYNKHQQDSSKKQSEIHTAKFKNFDEQSTTFNKHNIELLLDIPLEVTVELGRTKKIIREILDFQKGTVIELNKLAGEPVNILVNNKIIAKGEVVVIDENFAVRLTEIIDKQWFNNDEP